MNIKHDKIVLSLLEQAYSIISDERYWLQGEGKNFDAFKCHYRYCSVGALQFVFTHCFPQSNISVYNEAYALLCESARDSTIEHNQQLAAYNDTHTHAEVSAVWCYAIDKQKRKIEKGD